MADVPIIFIDAESLVNKKQELYDHQLNLERKIKLTENQEGEIVILKHLISKTDETAVSVKENSDSRFYYIIPELNNGSTGSKAFVKILEKFDIIYTLSYR